MLADLLATLMSAQGRFVSRDELGLRIWRSDVEYDSRRVEMTLVRLRRRLKSLGSTTTIQARWGCGYALIAPVVSNPPMSGDAQCAA